MSAYVYVTYRPDTGEFYIGSRTISAYVKPDEDVDYWGSGVWVKEMRAQKIALKKVIMRIYPESRGARAGYIEHVVIERLGWLPKRMNRYG